MSHPMPDAIAARLVRGIGKPCLFLPFVGEFGHLMMSHVRLVHFHPASVKIVCCKPGEQVLFPSAAGFITDWKDPLPDSCRVATSRNWNFNWTHLTRRLPWLVPIEAGKLSPSDELYAIGPATRIPFQPHRRGLKADVVLGVRHRKLFPERNWGHWTSLAKALTDAGKTFAVLGAKETSLDLPGQLHHSGDYDTDAGIELLENCQLYVGGDSGNSHLAATVGARMLLFRETASGSRDLTARMAEVNPGNIITVRGWDNPQWVINTTLSRLSVES